MFGASGLSMYKSPSAVLSQNPITDSISRIKYFANVDLPRLIFFKIIVQYPNYLCQFSNCFKADGCMIFKTKD